jgi:hypothetical protein
VGKLKKLELTRLDSFFAILTAKIKKIQEATFQEPSESGIRIQIFQL